MGRKKQPKVTVPVTFNIDPDHLEHLKRITYEMSHHEKKKFTISMLIRETLLQAYPLPKSKQMEMF